VFPDVLIHEPGDRRALGHLKWSILLSFSTGYQIFTMRSPNWLFLVLLLLLAGLQYRLWVGNGSLAQVASLTQQIADQHAENDALLERNRVLDAEVLELKKGLETVEERARHELGMVKEGETLYQLAQ
jgi:cell division protein FtsB